MRKELYCGIGQVSEMLGISRDTIKFYEEKGLINSVKDNENGYRKYSMGEIHNLFLINFYRELNIEIKRIKEIKDNEELIKIDVILKEQEEKLELEIKEKREILKKIKKTRGDYLNIINNIGKFSIKSLGPFKILEEIDERAIEDANEVVKKYKNKLENSGLSKRAHTLDNLLKEFSFNKEEILGAKHLVIKEIKNKDKGLFYESCLYSVIKIPVIETPEQGEKATMENFNLFKKKMKEMKLKSLGKVYLKMILGSFENGEEIMYLEAFAPIKHLEK
ncbi:MerR family transcriptional regulator [uncultured Clostridium sp.]|uniref:MerR family transcriptional regulator n=1 Tax=uncultured Clostridium sp. TaxID=59620 RepID=UPI00262BD67A|nr:MerR family transcriptional regulator [uncultured Clostridium sp.]